MEDFKTETVKQATERRWRAKRGLGKYFRLYATALVGKTPDEFSSATKTCMHCKKDSNRKATLKL